MEDIPKQSAYERGKFEGAVLQSLDDLKKQLKDYEAKHVESAIERGGLDERIRKLENFKSWILGAVAMSGTLGGLVGFLISNFLI